MRVKSLLLGLAVLLYAGAALAQFAGYINPNTGAYTPASPGGGAPSGAPTQYCRNGACSPVSGGAPSMYCNNGYCYGPNGSPRMFCDSRGFCYGSPGTKDRSEMDRRLDEAGAAAASAREAGERARAARQARAAAAASSPGYATAAPIPTREQLQAWVAGNVDPAGWTLVGADDRAAYFGDPTGLTKVSDTVLQGVFRAELFSPDRTGGTQTSSERSVWQLDCRTKQVRQMEIGYFSGHNLKNQVGVTVRFNKPWARPDPGPVAMSVADLCAPQALAQIH